MLHGEVIVAHESLAVAAGWLNLELPTTLAPTPLWRNEDEVATLHGRARTELSEAGLLRGDQLTETVTDVLHLLCSGAVEFYAYVDTADRDYRLHAAASGNDAVFACWVPEAGQVLLRPAKHDALAEEVVAELPECRAARGRSMSIAEAELPQGELGVDDPPRQGDSRRLLALYEQPRVAAGQLRAGVRGRMGGVKRSDPITFVDVEEGRWLTYFTVDGYGARTLVTAPGSRQVAADKLYELQNAMRARPRR